MRRAAREGADGGSAVDWSELPLGGMVGGAVHDVREYGVLCDLAGHPDVVALVSPGQARTLPYPSTVVWLSCCQHQCCFWVFLGWAGVCKMCASLACCTVWQAIPTWSPSFAWPGARPAQLRLQERACALNQHH